MEERKIAVVTGGSKGLGNAMARALIAQNWKVYCLSRGLCTVEGVVGILCDISNRLEVENAFTRIVDETNHIDLLINNAGMGISGAIEFTKEKDLKKIFDVNFFGAVYCTQQVIPIMRAQGQGKIIYISSMAAPCTAPFQTFYSASKSAINSLNEGVYLETKAFGIETCALLVGDRKTSFTDNREKSIYGNDLYFGKIEQCVSVMEEKEKVAPSADTIGEVVVELLKLDHLPLYYPCDDYGKVYEWSGYNNKMQIMDYLTKKYDLQ